MMNRSGRLFVSLIFGLFTACAVDPTGRQTGTCPGTGHLAAFSYWEHCLNYMDQETVDRGRDSLERSLERHAACAPADSAFWLYLDSVSAWHVASRPDSRQLERAAGYLDIMRGMLPAYHP